MKKTLMLVLGCLCCAYATRQEVVEEIKQELERDGHKLVGGPWYLDDDKDLSGMLGHKAMWGRRDKDGKLLFSYDKDGKLLWCYDKDGKWLGCYDKFEFAKDRDFTFDSVADIQDLAQKLRSGKCQYSYSLILYKDFEQLLKSGFDKVTCLYLDPRDFFFSIEKGTLEYSGCWTLNKAFFDASASPEKMAEFQKQFAESERLKGKILQIVREEHKAEVTRLEELITKSAEREAKLEAIITTTRNESAVLKELFSVACKKAEDDKQELHLLLQQTMAVISRQANLLHNTQLILKSLVDRGFGLPPEFMGLLADMHSVGAASSESH